MKKEDEIEEKPSLNETSEEEEEEEASIETDSNSDSEPPPKPKKSTKGKPAAKKGKKSKILKRRVMRKNEGVEFVLLSIVAMGVVGLLV
ncbi:hypothetical protein DID88_000855 [Monilinia fructigena]|uniref:Uncharacterized protein n=1 Tax=Monilinia fructigena TaxID=38457 RepID=A0A395IYD7_9HELO|nr:hypothetical protein DID88_000855 [Monilinia fructigena]